jgi:hypothetical protein
MGGRIRRETGMNVHRLDPFFDLQRSPRSDLGLAIVGDGGGRQTTTVTTSANIRMIAVFPKRGFEVRFDPESSLVEVAKDLSFFGSNLI